jgi:hypothetical protein
MNSSMISKIEKAHRYAREPHRVHFSTLAARFEGGHDDYQVELRDGEWHCNCHTFESHVVGHTCAHVMAMQEMLKNMLSDDARYYGAELAEQV